MFVDLLKLVNLSKLDSLKQWSPIFHPFSSFLLKRGGQPFTKEGNRNLYPKMYSQYEKQLSQRLNDTNSKVEARQKARLHIIYLMSQQRER